MELIIHQPDIAATVLQYLDDADILEFKLCNYFVKNLTETVVPRHHLFKVLQLIENHLFPLPPLQLPTHFQLDQKTVNKIHTYCCNVDRIITTFIIHYHINQFCYELMKHFSFDWKFVASLGQLQNYKDSPVMNTISQWKLVLLCEDASSQLWNATMWREKTLFFPMKSLTLLAIDYDTQCMQSRTLLVFGILQGWFNRLERFLELVQRPLWIEKYQSDPVVWNAFVSANNSQISPRVLRFLCSRFKDREEEEQESDIIYIVKQCAVGVFKNLSPKWFSNKNVVLAGISRCSTALNYATTLLQQDIVFIKEAVRLHPTCYLIAKRWYETTDPSFVKELFEFMSLFHPYPQKNDMEILLEKISISGYNISRTVHINTKSVALSAVCSAPTSLSCLSMRLTNDEDIVLTAVQKDYNALQYSAERFRNEKSMVAKVLQRNGRCLLHISKELQSDSEIVLLSLKYCPSIEKEASFRKYFSQFSRETLRQVVFESYGIEQVVINSP